MMSFPNSLSLFECILGRVSVILIVVCCLCLSCTQRTTPTNTPVVKPYVPPDLIKITSHYFDKLPQDERKNTLQLAKRINAFVYNYCISDPPIEKNLHKLLKNCRTSCIGYVHVFRQIAQFYGIQSRAVYLFNIPLQGNHSLLEIKYGEDKWALFDPTFGTFFTPEGKPSENPFSLDDLYFYCTSDTLIRHVVQARTLNPLDITSPLDVLYTPRSFKASYMGLSSYLSAEAYGNPDKYQYSLLWMNIDMRKNLYQFGGPTKNIQEGEERFLALINSLLKDDIQNNHISYNMSYLGEVGGHTYKNGYRLSHLKRGCIYRTTIYGINTTIASFYPHFTDTRAVLQHTGMQIIPEGKYEHSLLFRARDTNAELILEIYPKTEAGSHIRIFGIRIELCNALKSFQQQPTISFDQKSGT